MGGVVVIFIYCFHFFSFNVLKSHEAITVIKGYTNKQGNTRKQSFSLASGVKAAFCGQSKHL